MSVKLRLYFESCTQLRVEIHNFVSAQFFKSTFHKIIRRDAIRGGCTGQDQTVAVSPVTASYCQCWCLWFIWGSSKGNASRPNHTENMGLQKLFLFVMYFQDNVCFLVFYCIKKKHSMFYSCITHFLKYKNPQIWALGSIVLNFNTNCDLVEGSRVFCFC